jgi:hypothetical protein
MIKNPTAKMNRIRLVIIFCCYLSACATERTSVELPPQTVKVEPGQTLLIQLDKGQVQVLGSEGEQIEIGGHTFFPDEIGYKVIQMNDKIQIIAENAGNQRSSQLISLQVHVPHHIRIDIETSSASILVHDYEGDVEATSVSGDISAQNVHGNITTRSNRGDVKVEHSLGKFSIVGNYGLLTVVDVSGDIGVSTIMGTITFEGPIRMDDTVRLETDHGPIAVNLSPDSALSIQVRSTSGDVSCMLRGITSSLRTCDGVFNSVGGQLMIRTVSGAITVKTTR